MLQIAVPAHNPLYTTCTIGPAPLFAGGALGFGISLRNLLELTGAGIVGASKVWLGHKFMTKRASIDLSTWHLTGNISYANSVLHHLNSKFLSENQLCSGFGQATRPCGGKV